VILELFNLKNVLFLDFNFPTLVLTRVRFDICDLFDAFDACDLLSDLLRDLLCDLCDAFDLRLRFVLDEFAIGFILCPLVVRIPLTKLDTTPML
jgi:hypothetical protein